MSTQPDPSIAVAVPVLVPHWSIQCQRCLAHVEHRCRCMIIPGEIIGIARPPANGHSSSCLPTYRSDGGALPDRCPRCKAVNWLQPRAYVRGQGTSRATLYRRKAARR